ncbi:Palmitoyl-acyl carrier protein thioesterase, chloroplastic, partial [Mucuna pruriens]
MVLQETALNHVSSCGVSQNDFGATHEMNLRKLIWVVTRIQVQVHRYSKWCNSKFTWCMQHMDDDE